VRIEVRAVDRHGQEGIAAISPTVDNVAPSVILEPRDGDLLAAPVAVVRFSEPVLVEPVGQPSLTSAVAPAVSVSWVAAPDAGEDFVSEGRYQPLQPATSYVLSVPSEAVRDWVGQLNAETVESRFRTAPAAPASGEIALPKQVESFEVASDGLGGVALAARTAAGDLYFGRFHPRYGTFELLNTATGVLPGAVQLSAGTHSFEEGEATPIVGASWTAAEVAAAWKVGETALGGQKGPAWVVPFPSGCVKTNTEPGLLTSLDGVWKVVRGGELYSTSSASVPLRHAGVRASDWEFVYLEGSSMSRRRFTCSCPGCGLGAPEPITNDVKSGSALSSAVAHNGARLYMSQTTSENSEWCAASQDEAPSRRANADFIHVTTGASGGEFVGVRKTTTGGIEVLSRTVDGSCDSTWSVIGNAPTGAGAVSYRAALFGARPGAVYMQSGRLYAFVP
jgi:hypothetical protein